MKTSLFTLYDLDMYKSMCHIINGCFNNVVVYTWHHSMIKQTFQKIQGQFHTLSLYVKIVT